ncbi:MAG: hypothetical protein ACXWT0_00440 [Methylobacter sp.]
MNTEQNLNTAPVGGSWLNVVLGIVVLMLLSGCADNISFAAAAVREPVGFWYGLWHGMISPISWLISLFSDDVSIYAIYNNGGWYDFGFMLGVGALVSSSRAA